VCCFDRNPDVSYNTATNIHALQVVLIHTMKWLPHTRYTVQHFQLGN